MFKDNNNHPTLYVVLSLVACVKSASNCASVFLPTRSVIQSAFSLVFLLGGKQYDQFWLYSMINTASLRPVQQCILTILSLVEWRQALRGLQRQLLHLMGHRLALGTGHQQTWHPTILLCSKPPLGSLGLHPATGGGVGEGQWGSRQATGVWVTVS